MQDRVVPVRLRRAVAGAGGGTRSVRCRNRGLRWVEDDDCREGEHATVRVPLEHRHEPSSVRRDACPSVIFRACQTIRERTIRLPGAPRNVRTCTTVDKNPGRRTDSGLKTIGQINPSPHNLPRARSLDLRDILNRVPGTPRHESARTSRTSHTYRELERLLATTNGFSTWLLTSVLVHLELRLVERFLGCWCRVIGVATICLSRI